MRLPVRLGGSAWRKVFFAAAAVGAVVWIFQVGMLDSEGAARSTAGAEDAAGPQPGDRLSFTATAYCKGSVTSSGVAPKAGVAAADPDFLPVGSIVELDSPDPQYNGIYSILDTGPAVRGQELDIYIWSCHEALRFGRQEVGITVLRLGWTPNATAPHLLDRLRRFLIPSRSEQS
jgi:3D (Asp-Asp-Asp) domain-containing protein